MANKRVYDDKTGKEPLIDYIRDSEGVGSGSNAISSSPDTSSSSSNTAGSGASGNHSFYKTGAGSGPKTNESDTSANSDVEEESQVIDGGEGGKGGRGIPKNDSNSFYKPGKNKKSKLAAKVSSNKKTLILLGGGLGGMLAAGAVLLVFISSLMIPGFAQDILSWQFARVTRNFLQDSEQIAAEKAAVDGIASDAEEAAVQSSFKTTTDGLIAKFNSLTPNGVMRNLGTNGDLTYNYDRTSVLGRKYLSSISVGDETIPVSGATLGQRFNNRLHPFQTFQDQVKGAQDLSAGLDDSLRDSTGIIIRGAIENSIRKELGIGLLAYVTSKFKNLTPEDADSELATEAENAIDNPNTTPPETSLVASEQKAIDDGDAQQAADLNNKAALNNIVDNTDGVDVAADNLENNDIDSALTGFLKNFSIAFAIAVPICIIYDGSLDSPTAGPTIDNQDAELQRSFYYVESAADQQKDGGNVNAEAIGAMSRKVGLVAQSNAEQRASGYPVDTGSSFVSPQAGAGGQYSIANLAFGSLLGNAINTFAPTLCRVLTNPVVAVGLLLGQLIFEIITSIPDFGASAGAEQTGAEGLELAVDQPIEDIATNVASKVTAKAVGQATIQSLKNLGGKLGQMFTKKELAKVAALGAITMLAKMAVLQKSAETYNGLSEGLDFDNQADAGGNLNANEVGRQEFGGSPLTNTQVAYNNNEDATFIADQNNSKDFYQRYLALSNNNSLLSRVGVTINSDLSRHSISKMFSSIVSDLNPVKFGSSFLSLFDKIPIAHAAVTSQGDIGDYGIVQYGYTAQEQAMMDPSSNNPAYASYQPLENQQILSNSGKEAYIQAVYGSCYSPSLTMGDLLTQKPPAMFGNFKNPDTTDPAWIVRSADGDIIGGLCSQAYVGPNSVDKMAFDSTNGLNDLVFRYRLSQSYNNTMDQLTSIQNAPQAQN